MSEQIDWFHAADTGGEAGWYFRLIRVARVTVDHKSTLRRRLPMSGGDDQPALCRDPMSEIYQSSFGKRLDCFMSAVITLSVSLLATLTSIT